jgi:hypothetical protein|eukprot:COSAG01_NODE_2886_length_6891_cov_26.917780_6_plen_105_part_00
MGVTTGIKPGENTGFHEATACLCSCCNPAGNRGGSNSWCTDDDDAPTRRLRWSCGRAPSVRASSAVEGGSSPTGCGQGHVDHSTKKFCSTAATNGGGAGRVLVS